ncbi:hypothetical protein J6P92_07910 [bacterium]|nr:hypothetical protein [bacterium]
MHPISFDEIISLRTAKQNFSDCYLVSSINALTRTENGRKILSQNIQRCGENFCIRFNDVNGQAETYLVKQAECDELILMDKYLNPVKLRVPNHPIIKAIEVAMNKLLKLHPDKKPFLCKIPDCQERFEFNKASVFFKMFTGIRPITINESGLKMSLKNDEQIAGRIFNEMKDRKGSFVMGTGYHFNPFEDLPHCYAVRSTDNGLVELYDSRRQASIARDFDGTIKSMKYICGYFNDMLG